MGGVGAIHTHPHSHTSTLRCVGLTFRTWVAVTVRAVRSAASIALLASTPVSLLALSLLDGRHCTTMSDAASSSIHSPAKVGGTQAQVCGKGASNDKEARVVAGEHEDCKQIYLFHGLGYPPFHSWMCGSSPTIIIVVSSYTYRQR